MQTQVLDTHSLVNSLARSILLSLIMYKPLAYRAYQYKIYLHLAQYSNDGSLVDCQRYLGATMRVSNKYVFVKK
jgi:hypothetical protein